MSNTAVKVSARHAFEATAAAAAAAAAGASTSSMPTSPAADPVVKPSDVLAPEPQVTQLPLNDPLAIMDALYRVCARVGLQMELGLPTIAVVGAQSVGKTSVLESFVGRDFLPRGTGIVTRRPLVLQLRTLRSDSGTVPNEWAEFSHKPGKKMTDFNAVRSEIEAETDRVCGTNKCVSEEPIFLHVFSPNVLDLMLVDLPGLTKVPTGSQPEDIARSIRKLVLRYITPVSCIILAVSSANADLATSDALALAREVDPDGERTLGVLNKLDLADASGNAPEALMGRLYHLRLGYVGVVCRSNKAMKEGISFAEAIAAERRFLTSTPAFAGIAQQCGIPFLTRRLHGLLLDHIRHELPALCSRIETIGENYKQELATLGDDELDKADKNPGQLVLSLISNYARNFSDMLDGSFEGELLEDPPEELIGGARLLYVFHHVFAKTVLNLDPLVGLSDIEIRSAMRNAIGPKPLLFVPEVAFDMLTKRQIQRLEAPALECVQLVQQELKQLTSRCHSSHLARFNVLHGRVVEIARKVVQQCAQPTKCFVQDLIHIELAFVNVEHPDFIGGARAMSHVESSLQMPPQQGQPQGQPPGQQQGQPQVPQQQVQPQGQPQGQPQVPQGRQQQPQWQQWQQLAQQQQQSMAAVPHPDGGRCSRQPLRLPPVPLVITSPSVPSEKEQQDTALLKTLISSYLNIVKMKILDAVPKAIMHFMVNPVKEALHQECIEQLYRAENFDALLAEAAETRQRRQQCQQKCAELRRAKDLLATITYTGMPI
eukprot:NODE_1055_length_2630_cov_11.405114.p1 GENE.NODE_1055_length_2630_cov_11.405114~~NODE_1055_length_2630_cov_11.405114.p1  ORF type:complete len:844 (-),score=224.54 NODE_1055_length_2630_cov_11.405114:99-2411(-)